MVVPHPKFVRNGEWRRNGGGQPTVAVLCPCRVGQLIVEGQRGVSRASQMTLAQYEALVPRDWWTWFMANQYKAAGAAQGESVS